VEPSIQHASPAGFTSADAAGLPILPGLVNYNEVASHAMDHAIRFTAECTQESYLCRHATRPDSYVVVVRQWGAVPTERVFQPAGVTVFGLLSDRARHDEDLRLILADNGSNWYFQERRYAMDLHRGDNSGIPASQFVAVDESCLMISANSAQALQPGSAAFQASAKLPRDVRELSTWRVLDTRAPRRRAPR